MKHFGLASVPWGVAEIQGLYGPFAFSERLLQKIWMRGDFDSMHATTEDGRVLRVWHAGRWNLQGGPDFLQAQLSLGGERVTGDVELHLYASDWFAHAHAADRAYDRVVLHVVLFPPGPGKEARRADGTAIPTLALLPLLLHDLEEYAADDAIERLADRGDWRATEELAKLPPAETRTLLLGFAAARWRGKVHYARRRIGRLGWEEACHHTALEILGYRFNRAPMLKVAIRAPLARWSGGTVDIDALFAMERQSWSLQGVRPANHPRLRLKQYAAWTRARPDWPAALRRLNAGFSGLPAGRWLASTSNCRKRWGFARLRQRIAEEVTGGSIGGTRLDNLVCDGLLPLLAACTGRGRSDLWFHWYPGDLPPRFRTALRSLGLFAGRAHPACHGLAQGLLGWLLDREREAAAAPLSLRMPACGRKAFPDALRPMNPDVAANSGEWMKE